VPAWTAGGALRPGDHSQRRAASRTRPELARADRSMSVRKAPDLMMFFIAVPFLSDGSAVFR
jgi:hypothetical protein